VRDFMLPTAHAGYLKSATFGCGWKPRWVTAMNP